MSTKLKLVLSEGIAARRENAEAIKWLEKQIMVHGKKQVIEEVAYIWFNRFCAPRFDEGVKMNYNRFGSALKKVVGLTAKGE